MPMKLRAVVVSVPGTETHLFVRSGATLTIAANAVVTVAVVDPGLTSALTSLGERGRFLIESHLSAGPDGGVEL